MAKAFRRSLAVTLGALATTALGGCYYGDVYGSSYASGGDCASRYGADYYDYDGYAYDDGYGYDCYDASDYGGGFAQIGFGGGWYDNYYYPGYGLWLFDIHRNRYPLRGQYLNYWGGRRAWWKHHGGHGDGNWNRPGRGDGDGRPGRPGGWNGQPGHGDGNGDGRPGRPGGWTGHPGGDGQHGTRPGEGSGGQGGNPPTTTNPVRPGGGPSAVRPRPSRGEGGGYVRPRPAPPVAQGEATTDRPAGAQRPVRTWAPPQGGRTPRGPEAVRPRPAPSTERPAAVRPPAAPPSAAPRYTPPAQRQAPERSQRFERSITPDKD